MVILKEVKSIADYNLATVLFREYAEKIGVDLSFQDFDKEISNLQNQYSHPTGALYIAFKNKNNPVGCFAVRKLDGTICELKRMYVRIEARGLGFGKELLLKSLLVAKELGYQKMRLDTLPTMSSAIGLYEKFGFYEISSYRYNPIEGTKYFEIAINQSNAL